MVRHRIANPTLRNGRVGSTPTLSARDFLTRKNMKPNKTFKMSKSFKRLTRTLPFTDAEQRNAFKRMMIDAQLMGGVRPAREKSEK